MSGERPILLIIGAGFGGLGAATQLIANGGTETFEVILVDNKDYFTIGGMWQFAWTSRSSLDDLKWPLKDAILPGIELRLNLTVIKWNVEAKTVDLSDGSSQSYDHIILAPGVVPDSDPIPGIENHVNVCTMGTVERQEQELDELVNKAKSGAHQTFVYSIGSVPYKCPPVPFETASLVDERLRKEGVRDNCRVVITCPIAWPMPPPYEKTFLSKMAEKGIEWMPNKSIQKIENGVIHFKDGTSLETTLLWTSWPLRAPDFVKEAVPLNEKGCVTVDNVLTNSIPNAENAYIVGDCCTVPLPGGKALPKAGEFAWPMGISAADACMKSVQPAKLRGNCVAEMGNGQALAIAPDFSDMVNDSEHGKPKFGLDVVSSGGDTSKVDWANDVLQRIFGPKGRKFVVSTK